MAGSPPCQTPRHRLDSDRLCPRRFLPPRSCPPETPPSPRPRASRKYRNTPRSFCQRRHAPAAKRGVANRENMIKLVIHWQNTIVGRVKQPRLNHNSLRFFLKYLYLILDCLYLSFKILFFGPVRDFDSDETNATCENNSCTGKLTFSIFVKFPQSGTGLEKDSSFFME